MISRKQKKLYKEMSMEVSQICATCKFAAVLHSTDGLLCSKNGVVTEDGYCKKYKYNEMLKRPSVNRNLLNDRFSESDFQID